MIARPKIGRHVEELLDATAAHVLGSPGPPSPAPGESSSPRFWCWASRPAAWSAAARAQMSRATSAGRTGHWKQLAGQAGQDQERPSGRHRGRGRADVRPGPVQHGGDLETRRGGHEGCRAGPAGRLAARAGRHHAALRAPGDLRHGGRSSPPSTRTSRPTPASVHRRPDRAGSAPTSRRRLPRLGARTPVERGTSTPTYQQDQSVYTSYYARDLERAGRGDFEEREDLESTADALKTRSQRRSSDVPVGPARHSCAPTGWP